MFPRVLQKEKKQTKNIKNNNSEVKSLPCKRRSSVTSKRTFNQNICCFCKETDIEKNLIVAVTSPASRKKTLTIYVKKMTET